MKVTIEHGEVSAWAIINMDADLTYTVWFPIRGYGGYDCGRCRVSIMNKGKWEGRHWLDNEGNVIGTEYNGVNYNGINYNGPWLGWLIDLAIENGLEIPK